jgi:23S rRNA pseudouridine2605 synthase
VQKILASAGVASRRAAEELIRAGRVSVNGVPAHLGQSADPSRDVVTLDGEPVHVERPVYWIVHKPVGVVSTVRDPEGRTTVLDLLPARVRQRLVPVGRLDRGTGGLLLLTNHGALLHALLHPSRGVEREYVVEVRGSADDATLGKLAAGVRLEDGITAPARVTHVRHEPRTDTTRFHLTLTEGRKRQIRRAMAALRHPVVKLTRIRFGPLRLGSLEPGAARALSDRERRALLDAAEAAERSARAAPCARRRVRRAFRRT